MASHSTTGGEYSWNWATAKRHHLSPLRRNMFPSLLMEEMNMNEIALFVGSFVFVFALSYQQQNVHYRRYLLAVVNSAFIASLNLLVVKLGSQASPTEMLAFVSGQPLGTVAAMWLGSRSQSTQTRNSPLDRETA